VDGLGCFGVRRLEQTVDLTLLLTELVPKSHCFVPVLSFEVLLAGLGHRFGR
jgi:hypothetical protein